MTLYIDNLVSEGLLDHKSHRTQTLVTTVSAGTLTLTSTSESLQVFTGTTSGQIVKLPDATTLSVGYRYQFNNDSTQNVAIQNSASTQLLLLASTQRAFFLLTNAGTAAGTWSYIVVNKLPATPEQFLVTYPGTGLSVDYTGGNANFDGSFTQVAGGSIALPASTTDGWIYVDIDGVVKATASIPNNALTLYKFTTSTDTVTSLSDYRDDYDQNLVWGVVGDVAAVRYNSTANAGTLEKYARADHTHAANFPLYKSGSVAQGSFTGNPKTAAVTFTTAFPSTSYAVTVTGSDGRSWIVTNITTGGFTINAQANQDLTGPVFWNATLIGESQ